MIGRSQGLKDYSAALEFREPGFHDHACDGEEEARAESLRVHEALEAVVGVVEMVCDDEGEEDKSYEGEEESLQEGYSGRWRAVFRRRGMVERIWRGLSVRGGRVEVVSDDAVAFCTVVGGIGAETVAFIREVGEDIFLLGGLGKSGEVLGDAWVVDQGGETGDA